MKLKRIMAIVLCFAMVLSTMSFNVFAQEATTVSDAEALASALTSDQESIEITLEDDIEVPISSLGNQTSGSGEYKLGGENTKSIVIDLNNHKMTITTSYMSAIGAKNENATITIKNGAMNSTGNSAATWNINDLMFANCNYEFENVIFDKEVALTNTGKNVTMKNVTINGTGDYYALWIQAEGQNVTIDGLTINAAQGRGIKIDEQYSNENVAKVTLDVSNATFTTAKKAAIVVKSVEGAEITTTNVDILAVAADSKNIVWVDEDSADYQDKVIVNDNAAFVEGTVATVNGVAVADVETAFAQAVDGNEVKIYAAGTYKVPTGKDITIIGAAKGVKFDMSNAVGINASMTFTNVTFEYGNANYKGLQHAGDMVYNDCTINGQVSLYGTTETFNNCTFNQTSSDAYNVWTYGAKKVDFNECTFNSAGKSVLIYSEDANLFNDVTVTKTTFNASTPVDGKAAIEMDSSLTAGINLAIDADTTATGFDSGNVSGNSLWNNKKGNTGANNDITVVVNGETVLEPKFAAEIGNTKYESLSLAISKAQSGNIITLLKDVTENVTIDKSITLNGADKQYTGAINVSGDVDVVIENVNFVTGSIKQDGTKSTAVLTVKNCDFTEGTTYAVTTNRIKAVTIEKCTVDGQSLLYANKSTPNVLIKDVIVKNANYGLHWVYGTKATLENVTMTDVQYGIMVQNYADKTITIKKCDISGANPIYIWEKTNETGVQTFVFEGINSLGETEFTISDYAKLKLADADSVLKACEGLTVTSDNEKYNVIYEDDAYKVEKVAKIGEKTYITLQDALADAKDGDIITLIWNEGNAPIAMNGYVSGKTVTITGTAEVDWEKGFLFVGRTNDGTEASDAKLIFENATLTTTAGGDHGIHVSGAEKGSATKANGTVEIKNSKINLTYLINKGAMSLDNSTLTVKSGFSVGGRPASETESGKDATATIDLTNNSKVIVNNHNGMGLGYEAIGIMNIDESSAFECTQDFLITAKGTMNVNGTVNVTGALNVKGTLASRGDIYGEIVKASDDAVIEVHAGVYSYDPTDYVVNGLQAVYDDVTKLYTVIGTHTINIEATPAECYDEQTVKVTVEVNGADFANAEWKLTYNKDVVKYVGYEDNTNGIDEVSPKVSEGVIEDKLYTHTAGDPFKGNTVLVTYIFETRSQNSDDVKAVFTLSNAIVDTWYSSNFGDTEVDGDSAEVVVKRRDFEGITISDTANGQTSDITNKIVEGVYAIYYDGFAHEFAVDTSVEDETINYVITKDGAAVTEILAKGTYEIEYTIEKLGYKPFTGSFKVVIGDPDFVLETSTYTLENYTLVMVYMNAEGMAPTFGGKQMYDITSSGYRYQANSTDEGTPYKFVYGIVIPEPEVSEDLTLKVAFNTADAIEMPSYDEDVNFVGGVTDRDAVVTINTYKGNKGQLEDYNLLSRVLKADVDKNKKVNMEDVTMVERAAAK